MKMISASIVGASGYTGGELLRLLVNHPQVTVISVISKSNSGKKVSDVFTDLTGETDLLFTNKITEIPEVVFLCLPHGESVKYLQDHQELLKTRIIDLGRDFRLNESASVSTGKFVYGLPELNKTKISLANYVANPGCFATCIQLALLPLAQHKLLHTGIVINATTGSTGAGIKPGDTTHFSWRQNNLSVYQPFEHNHNSEILQSVKQLQNDFSADFTFIPQRGSFTRGILATVVTECNKNEDELKKIYHDFYSNHPFTKLIDSTVDLKMVVNTNKCFINIKKHGKQVLITSVIDNLLKGASGQAVQNMNLMFGLNETDGLKLKSSTH